MPEFSCSNAKMMLFHYKDKSMRIVMGNHNLTEFYWTNKTQTLWISPRLPTLPEDSLPEAGESPTKFRQDFLSYLKHYKLPEFDLWIDRIKQTDFSAIK